MSTWKRVAVLLAFWGWWSLMVYAPAVWLVSIFLGVLGVLSAMVWELTEGDE